MKIKFFVVLVVFFAWNCGRTTPEFSQSSEQPAILTGAERLDMYLPELKGKRIGLVVNQTSRVGDTHLVDTLVALGVDIRRIFAPEHGFRGTADAGEKITDGKDPATGIPLVSLYGAKRKPAPEDLADLDWVVFDIQDVGARFYTFISTMHYVMSACGEQGVLFMVLDRPNPNGHYVDGPVLDTAFRSFVGMHPVPVMHGMTVGEYALMIEGEGWLDGGVGCTLLVIPCANYNHQSEYILPVKPSPNLPNNRAIYLYPSLCFFEGTEASVGRGTDKQFQVYGAPDFPGGDFTFTPVPMPGATRPKHQDRACNGFDLSGVDPTTIREEKRLNLSYLVGFIQAYPDPGAFISRPDFFDLLAGGETLRTQLLAGKSEAEIRQSWEPALSNFKALRKPYLLYE